MNEKQSLDDIRMASGSAEPVGLPQVATLISPAHGIGIFRLWGALLALPHTSNA